jgi:hypothetical protein
LLVSIRCFVQLRQNRPREKINFLTAGAVS